MSSFIFKRFYVEGEIQGLEIKIRRLLINSQIKSPDIIEDVTSLFRGLHDVARRISRAEYAEHEKMRKNAKMLEAGV